MKIVGGIYREICVNPPSDNIYGSAMRAAIAISKGCEDLVLIGLGELVLKKKILTIAETFKFRAEIQERPKEIGFVYDTLISSPKIYGVGVNRMHSVPTVKVTGINVLSFAMVEANMDIRADYLVVDPQGLSEINDKIRWSSKHLAIVANKWEVIRLLDTTEKMEIGALAEKMREKYNAEVVVIKCGALGAVLSDSSGTYGIQAYYTTRVNPIGSGDIFSAVFAYYWAELRLLPEIAAKYASMATSEWVMNGPLQVISDSKTVTAPNSEKPVLGLVSKVYLAAPFFTVSDRWLVDLCRSALIDLGATVFSPLHDVGIGNTDDVALQDIEGLTNANSILALLDGMDPGTIFEVGYGSALKKSIIIYVGNKNSSKLTMIRTHNTHIHDDLASAVYDAVWLGIPK